LPFIAVAETAPVRAERWQARDRHLKSLVVVVGDGRFD